MAVLDSTQIQNIAANTYPHIVSNKEALAIDRKELPLLMWFDSIKKETGLAGGVNVFKNKIQSSAQITTWRGSDVLPVTEPTWNLDLTYGYANMNLGINILHDEAKRMGFTILPNGNRAGNGQGGNFSPMSQDDAFRLLNWVKETVEERNDAWKRSLSMQIHRSGAASPSDLVGLDAILPLTTAASGARATAGTVGGKSRSQYPQVAHYMYTGMTTGAGGTIQQAMTLARRQANLYSRGVKGGVDIMFAGSTFIDAYKAWFFNNGIRLNTDIGAGDRKVDLGIPDEHLYFEGIPIVFDPFLDEWDSIDTGATIPYAKRCYMLNSKTWKWMYQSGMDGYASSPADPPNVRTTRLDIDGTYVLACIAPASNAVVSVA